MTLIKTARGPNPLIGFSVDPASLKHVGHELQRPECILAERDGTLWAADARGGVMRIDPDGKQQLVVQSEDTHFDLQANAEKSLMEGTLPNGLAFDRNGDFLIANFGTDRLERMTRSGTTTVILDEIEGKPIGKANFILRDSKDRLWLTVSTRLNPWPAAMRKSWADGYIILIDERGARIVADGFHMTNEIRMDANEEWLYVAETTAKRVSRLRVNEDGSLTDREVYGPSSLGDGFVDGITFDSYGNLWATMIQADRLVAITPEGDVIEIFNDGDRAATARLEAAWETGELVPMDVMMASGGPTCTWLASITFGGSDLKKVYLGGLRSTSIPYFECPVAGLPMVHW